MCRGRAAPTGKPPSPVSDLVVKRLAAVVAACLVAVVALGSVLGSRSVADDLRQRSEAALAAAGLTDVRIDYAGREARLRGGNDVQARLALALVETLPGVRSVADDRPRRRDLSDVARFELDRAGDDVEISGAVPSPDDAAAIKVAVASTLRVTVTGDVEVRPALPSASWTDDLPDVLEAVAGVDGLALEIRGDGTATLAGTVADPAERSRVANDVAAALPGLDLDATLRVVPPREGR